MKKKSEDDKGHENLPSILRVNVPDFHSCQNVLLSPLVILSSTFESCQAVSLGNKSIMSTF